MVGRVIMVSTDGSCLKNPGGAIGWAWVDHTGESASGGARSGTNQIAELTAVAEAIAAHPGDEPLMIESDSQYAIKCVTEWLPGWKRRGWKTASGSAVKNADLIKAIDAAIAERPGPVRFRWVRGHVGNEYNEMADRLAGEAARAARDRPSGRRGGRRSGKRKAGAAVRASDEGDTVQRPGGEHRAQAEHHAPAEHADPAEHTERAARAKQPEHTELTLF